MPIDSKGHFYLVTSENMWIKELVLAVNTPALTGCSHTGIHQIAKRVHEETKLDIFAIFGGFHLLKSSHEKIAEISDGLQKMNIKKK